MPPAGCYSSGNHLASDAERSVRELVEECTPGSTRIVPVGRLDVAG
jgi:16S rRNA U516 pseudouridylate synthase RsuA-like enzyme